MSVITAIGTDQWPKYDFIEIRIWVQPRPDEDGQVLFDQLFDRLMDDPFVCDPKNWEPCWHCQGTAVNPPPDPAEENPGGAEGLPCIVCGTGAAPGYVRPCGRVHSGLAEIIHDGLTRKEHGLYEIAQGLCDRVESDDIDQEELLQQLKQIVGVVRPWSKDFGCEDCGDTSA